MTNTFRRTPGHLIELSDCDLVVADSSFKRISVNLAKIGELWVGLPWSLDYPNLGWRVVVLTEDSWGCDGVN